MSNPDKALDQYNKICSDFTEFLQSHGTASETDTRIKFIDRILKEVLEWPEPAISREDHTDGSKVGYTDYQLKIKNKPYIVVEAKREGVAFTLPKSDRRRLKISGALSTSNEVKEAINQVRQYCVDDLIINYAIATNGYTWIIFKTTQGLISWKEATAVVFYSSEDILEKFVDFWNLLSFDSLTSGSLEKEFASITVATRNQYRVIDNLINANRPLERNRLHSQLSPIIDTFFGDIADQEHIEILESCYIFSRSVDTANYDLDNVIIDRIPKLLKNQGAKDVFTGEKDSGIFDTSIASAIEKNAGHLYLLLAGIGAGKTTFIKRYQ